MKWQHKFQNFILERGRGYYSRKLVRNLTYKDDCYTAQVLGNSIYHVMIRIEDEKITDMECSCPYAEGGKKCKHMAAVLFAIDEADERLRPKKSPKEEKTIQPFELNTDEYHYFDMGRIVKNYEFSESRFAEAVQMVKNGSVILEKVDVGYVRQMTDVTLCGVAQGYYIEKKQQRLIKITFDRNGIVQAVCSVFQCGGYYENAYYYSRKNLCKHIMALLILLDGYLKKYNPGDSTDMDAVLLMNGFRSQHVKEVTERQTDQKQDLMFEPILERNGDVLQLSFKAGTDRLFVVKDLTEFVNLYEDQSMIKFGTKTEISLAKHRLHDSSAAIFEYVRQMVKQVQDREEFIRMSMRFYDVEEIKNRIDLYGERLDQFYALYDGKEISCNNKKGGKTEKITLTFREGKPNIRLQIEKDVDEEGIFHGVQVKGKVPDFVLGRNYRYYFTKDSFCRISCESLQEIEPLLKLGEYGDISFHVGRKSLSEFYHQVLPVLKHSVSVKEIEPEIIQEYIPPEAVFAFYLDAEKGRITCKPKAHYGDETVSLLDYYKADSVLESFRNRNQEVEILSYVQQLFQEVNVEQEELHCEETEEAVLHLLEGGVDRLMALGEVHTTDRFRSVNIRKKPKLKVGVSIESDIMNLSISSDDLDQEELLDILKRYQKKKKYYRLKSGGLVEVNETDVEMLQQMMETLHLSAKDLMQGDMKVPMYRALYLNKMLEQSEHIYLNRDKHFRNLIKEFKTVDDSDFEVPESLTSIMRNYQVRGFQWMKTLEHYGFGGILADDMGLGKTLQMISVLLSAKENGESGTALIVCPASLVYNWKEEFVRFAPEMRVTLVVGTQQERAELIANYRESDVLVTSYDLLKRDIAEYEGKSFRYQVLDEAQYIKNHTTAAAKSVKVIESKQRYALTGTPIENRLSELWSIFDYLMPGFLYGYETFRKELETPIVKNKDKQASERLKKMAAPFILRRLKGDVLKDLPDKIEEIRYARLNDEQQKLYDGQVIHMREVIANQDAEDFQKNKLQILAELTRIRQICCDPELLFEKYRGGSAKRAACVELIQSAMEGEHKILVFSQFTSMLELLERDLKKETIAYYKIIGDTPKQKRVEMVNAFNSDDTPVFLISLKAGGTGLNLTGADVVIHYDPWWNQAVQNQATDRAHRIGQTRGVSVYKLIAKDTIEEKIVKMQESKRDLADSVLSGEMGGIARMSKAELLELLGE